MWEFDRAAAYDVVLMWWFLVVEGVSGHRFSGSKL